MLYIVVSTSYHQRSDLLCVTLIHIAAFFGFGKNREKEQKRKEKKRKEKKRKEKKRKEKEERKEKSRKEEKKNVKIKNEANIAK